MSAIRPKSRFERAITPARRWLVETSCNSHCGPADGPEPRSTRFDLSQYPQTGVGYFIVVLLLVFKLRWEVDNGNPG